MGLKVIGNSAGVEFVEVWTFEWDFDPEFEMVFGPQLGWDYDKVSSRV